ncbi:MAG: hypothetical protein SGJ17_14715 [Hyphomicrobiales bacterium]|nr:hypothetical protein [Hyphomicrobiales bacterium]
MSKSPIELIGHPATLIESTLDRLADMLDEETSALRGFSSADVRRFNERKSQALLELTKAIKHGGGLPADPALRPKLERVKVKLEANNAALQIHLSAMREISLILLGVIHDADSDGTYSITPGKGHAR